MKSYGVAIQRKRLQQYFHMGLFLNLFTRAFLLYYFFFNKTCDVTI